MKTTRISFLATLLLSSVFVIFFYGDVLIAPNRFMFSDSGDGIKNYFTYAWHIRYDSSLVNFEGMNYPYGEHFMYTDCHPFFTLAFRLLKPVFPAITRYCVGFLNLFMILSFVFTALITWLVLRELKTDPWLAAAGSVGIMMLSPQVFRLTGHLALSYGFAIPLTLFLLLKTFANPRRKIWLWLQSANILFLFFTHAYLGMMAAGFALCFWILYFGVHFREVRCQIRHWLPLLLWVVIPIVMFVLLIRFTDIHAGRTPNPSGFFLNNAEPDDLIVPHFPPLRPFWDRMTKVYQNWEGWSYLGLTTILVLAGMILITLFNLITQKQFVFSDRLQPDRNFRIALWASLILLLFAFGMPFKLYPPMVDWLPPIKQYRATGRFAWVFFYLSAILGVVVISNLSRWKKWLYAPGLVAVLFLGVEGYPYHVFTGRQITTTGNLFDVATGDSSLLTLAGRINPDEFQAILPLPFFYNGSENFTIREPGNSLRNALVLSYYTGLPVMGAQLTRTGISESRNIVQVISPGFYAKAIRPDLPSEKPFLVLRSQGALSPYQQQVQDMTTYLAHTDRNVLYKLELNDLVRNSAAIEIQQFIMIRDSLFPREPFLATSPAGFLYLDDFDHLNSDTVFRGSGALTGMKRGIHTLAGFEGGTFESGKTYIASVWMYNGHLDALNDWFRLVAEEYNEPADQWIENWVLPEQSEVIFGDWSLIEMEFTLNNPRNYFSLKLKGKPLDNARFVADELLIREKGMDVYRMEEEQGGQIRKLFYNNHRIIKD